MWKLKPGRMPALNCQKMNAPMVSATSAFTIWRLASTVRQGALRTARNRK